MLTTDAVPLTGLSPEQAAARLRTDGANELPQQRERGWWPIVVRVAREPMVQLLGAAGLVYLLLGDRGEALMLIAFVVITASITIIQERRTERVLDALRDLSSPRALVLRGGQRLRIAGRELVRGDLVFLAEGDRVPADARLLEANDLQADESLLTGESVPVRKRAGTAASPARPGGDDLPWVYAGTMVVRGRGLAEVVATGPRSELGKIGGSLAGIAQEPTPLTRQTRRLVRACAILGLVLSGTVVIGHGLIRGDWLAGVLAGITLAMAMLPEEFVMILAVFMAMGAHRLSLQRVLTRRAEAIETLGSATLLCTDKTGTLTENRMTLIELVALGDDGECVWRADQANGAGPLGAAPASIIDLLETGILACEREAFDPMEKAFHDLGTRLGLPTHGSGHADWTLVHEYPLMPGLLAMTHVWQAPAADGQVVAIKGAPEAVLGLCGLDPARALRVQGVVQRLAARGIRVLGVARAAWSGRDWPAEPGGFHPEFLGLVGLADPLRDSVPGAVSECRAAGIDVAMITGDYPATALAIASQAGIETGAGVLEGEGLGRLNDAQLRERIARVRVFARVTPEQKLRLIRAFRQRGEVVAMTGDGVNDAPSLKAAQIGIAMGGRGTDVAREAAAIVLLDDRFGAIVAAVRLGRRIHDNLRKAMAFVLAVHVPIAGLALLPLLFGMPAMFSPVHIAFLELVIDPICSIVFEAEPEERDVMARPPRDPTAALLSPWALAASLLQGLMVLAAVAVLMVVLLAVDTSEPVARASGFIALLIGNLGLVLRNRSFEASWQQVLTRRNPALWWVIGASTGLMGLVFAIEPLRFLFRFGLPDPASLLAAGLAGVGVLVVLVSLPIGVGPRAGAGAARGSARRP